MAEHEYPAEAVGRLISDALRKAPRGKRRTAREAAAERLVEAIAALIEEGIDSSDLVAFEDARAAVEKYRRDSK